MTELKAKMLGQTMNEYRCDTKIYLKSEADKVIAELEESHKMEVEQLLILNREQAISGNKLSYSMEQALRHQKFKRCWAMAIWCRSRACFYDTMREDGPYWRVKSDRAYKWHKRWLKIADRFNERKE